MDQFADAGSTPAASTEAPHDLAVVGGLVVGASAEAGGVRGRSEATDATGAPKGAAAEHFRVRAERNEVLTRTLARLSSCPARRPRDPSPGQTAGPSRRLHFGILMRSNEDGLVMGFA